MIKKNSMKVIKFHFISLLLFSSCGFAQTMSLNESVKLQNIVYHYFDNSPLQSYVKAGSASETFLLLLSTNNNGEIDSISFLSDTNNKDSGFVVISRLKADIFKTWQSKKCKNKTIMIPITILSQSNNPSYVRNIATSKFFKLSESGNLIVLEGFTFGGIISKE